MSEFPSIFYMRSLFYKLHARIIIEQYFFISFPFFGHLHCSVDTEPHPMSLPQAHDPVPISHVLYIEIPGRQLILLLHFLTSQLRSVFQYLFYITMFRTLQDFQLTGLLLRHIFQIHIILCFYIMTADHGYQIRYRLSE